MNESSEIVTLKNASDISSIPQRILTAAYLSTSSSDSETGLGWREEIILCRKIQVFCKDNDWWFGAVGFCRCG